MQENTDRIMSDLENVCSKRTVLYILGDVAFDIAHLRLIGQLPGRKILIKGNHDDYVPTYEHTRIFNEVHGMIAYKGMWLSHCPIHPDELRKKHVNLHGHVHTKSIHRGWGPFRRMDTRYMNLCVDELWRVHGKSVISLDEIRSIVFKNGNAQK